MVVTLTSQLMVWKVMAPPLLAVWRGGVVSAAGGPPRVEFTVLGT